MPNHESNNHATIQSPQLYNYPSEQFNYNWQHGSVADSKASPVGMFAASYQPSETSPITSIFPQSFLPQSNGTTETRPSLNWEGFTDIFQNSLTNDRLLASPFLATQQRTQNQNQHQHQHQNPFLQNTPMTPLTLPSTPLVPNYYNFEQGQFYLPSLYPGQIPSPAHQHGAMLHSDHQGNRHERLFGQNRNDNKRNVSARSALYSAQMADGRIATNPPLSTLTSTHLTPAWMDPLYDMAMPHVGSEVNA
jgi:hypothetical protein